MKLKLNLLLFCLLGIGVFSHAQDKKKAPGKPTVENGKDAIPITVTSSKKAKKPLPPPPPPKIVKDAEKPLPPPPPPAKPVKAKAGKPVTPDMPPMPDDKG